MPQVNPGLSLDRIRDFERLNGVSLPDDYFRYLCKYDGFQPSEDSDSWESVECDGFEFFQLSGSRLLVAEGKYLEFCEWVPGHIQYSIFLEPSLQYGQVAARYGAELYFLTPSFTSFVELYISDSLIGHKSGASLGQVAALVGKFSVWRKTSD